MPRVERSALLMHTPAQIYALVDDIERYPEFLPWCAGARELSRDADAVVAELQLRRGGLTGAFTTRNTLRPSQRIDLALVDGPFRHLAGVWTFDDIGGGAGCRVSLDLEFEAAGLVARPIAMLLQSAAGTLVDAFSKRARVVYG